MNTKIETFNKVMNTYRFVHPILPDMQADIIAAGRKDLKLIYKRFGSYGIIFAILLFIYNLFNRAGITVTFLKCKIILAAVTVLITAAGIYSAGHLVQYYINEPAVEEKSGSQVNMYDRPAPGLEEEHEFVKSEKAATLSYIIGIDSFSGTDEALTVIVTDKIFENLKDILGENKITHLDNKNRRKLPRIIDGSVRRLGDSSNIIIKIINITSAKTEFAATEKFRSDAEIDEACYRISKKIAENIRR